ncbi:hypothetical protein [Bryobacter aggregatus]|uniref:hypothetical protein n=1 Tax=Bryobacter aggregatus TaxID=360054 RepID=UPI0004E135C2|nr:hypothetical protein [Bryobacter aggregatus]
MRFAFLLAILISVASANIINYGPTNQTLTYTGLGPDAQGHGTVRVSWGSCVFENGVTTCTLSGPYTGIGSGGTFTVVVTYAGNGPSPLIGTVIPGTDTINLGLTAGAIETKLTINGNPTTFYYTNLTTFFNTSNAVCTLVTSCAVGQVGLIPGATITGPVTGQFDATPIIRGVVSASAYGGFSSVAPGSWMEVYGINLANVLRQTWSGADFKGNIAPTALGGTTLTIGGKPAYLDYVDQGQVNAQVPSSVPSGPQPVVITTAGGASAAYTINVNSVEPGLLAPAVFKLAAGQYVAALFPDGVTFVLPPAEGIPARRARPGETIILYGIGFGPVTPDTPAGTIQTQSNRLVGSFQCSIGGTQATVSYAGQSGNFVGLYQFNVVVPSVAAGEAVPFTYTLGGVPGPQSLLIPIGN